MCRRFCAGVLRLLLALLPVLECLEEGPRAPRRLRITPDNGFTSTPHYHLLPRFYLTPDFGDVGQPPRGRDEDPSYSSAPWEALESGSPEREAPGVEQSQRQAPEIGALKSGAFERKIPGKEARGIRALETRSPDRKRPRKLQEVLWRILRGSRRRTEPRKIINRAVCGNTYNVTRNNKYKLILLGRKPCNVIFRAAPHSAFKVRCPTVSVASCSRAQLHLSSSAGDTHRYCGQDKTVSVNKVQLTDLLVSYKVVGDASSSPRGTVTKCTVLGTKGDGYRAVGKQPCPRRCGITNADAEANPPPEDLPPPTSSERISSVAEDTTALQRIQGGKDASIGEWPWMLSLKLRLKGSVLFCGGTILSPKFILTAAHCVYDVVKGKGDWVRVVAYEYDRKDPNETPSQVRLVKRIFVHPSYSPETQEADIAVLLLKKELLLGEGVAPVCLAPPGSYEGSPVVLLGWGSLRYGGKNSKVLRESTQTVVNLQECVRNYTYLPGRFPITYNHVCTAAPGIDTCEGDSGGPILVQTGTTWYQLGIVSFGYRCAVPSYPGVNTLVPNYATWVLSIVEGSSCA